MSTKGREKWEKFKAGYVFDSAYAEEPNTGNAGRDRWNALKKTIDIRSTAPRQTAQDDSSGTKKGFFDRLGLTVSGGAKGSLAGNMDAMGVAYEAGQSGRTKRDTAELKDAQWAVARAKHDYDADPSEVNKSALEIATTKMKAFADVLGEGAYEQALEAAYDAAAQFDTGDLEALYNSLGVVTPKTGTGVQQQAAKAARDLAARVQDSATEDILEAKDGTSKFWQMAIDAGASATQMALDAVSNAVLGTNGSMVPFATRAFGGATMEARQGGADLGKQALYGAAQTAKEVFTEKMFNIALPYAKTYGKGGFDGIVENGIRKAADKLGKSKIGKAALEKVLTFGASAATEGMEELIGDWMEWQMPRIYGGDVATAEETLSDSLYDFVVGFMSGMIGGAMTGPMKAINSAVQAQEAKKAYGAQQLDLVNESEELSPGNELAKKYRERLDGGKNLSGRQLIRLIQQNETDMLNGDKAKIQAATEKRLTELGESDNVRQLAEIVARQMAGEELSRDEQMQIDGSKYGKRVLNELNPSNIRSGGFASGWAKSIGTNTINHAEYNAGLMSLAGDVAGVSTSSPVSASKESAPTVGSLTPAAVAPATERFTASESGKLTNKKTGADLGKVEITSSDGKSLKLKTESGEIVDAKDVDFRSKDEAMVYSAVLDMGVSPVVAQSIVDNFDGTDGRVYAADVNLAYQYGKMNFPKSYLDKLDIKPHQAEHAYNLGRSDAKAEAVAPKTKRTVKGKRGTVIFETAVDESALTPIQKASINGIKAIADLSGLNVHVFESRLTKDGYKFTLPDGTVTGANGWYVTGTNDIWIDLNAGNAGEGTMLYTAAHEISHFIKEWSPTKWRVLADFLLEQYGEDVPLDALLERQMAKVRKNNPDLQGNALMDAAYEELVSDAMSEMLVDGEVVQKLAELKQKDKTLWEKIKDAIRDLLEKWGLIRKEYEGRSVAGEAEFLRGMDEAFSKLQDMYAEAFADADANFSVAGLTVDNSINMESDVIDSANVGILGKPRSAKMQERTEYLDAPKQAFSVSTTNGKTDAKMVTADDIRKEGWFTGTEMSVKALRDARFKQNGFTKKQIDAMNGFIKKAADAMAKARLKYRFIGLDDVYNAQIVISPVNGSITISAMVKNGEYAVNFDFTKICKKRVALQQVIEELAMEKGRLNEDGTTTEVDLSSANIKRINDILASYGVETACLCCFVESKRYNMQSLYQEKVIDVWNRLVAEFDHNAPYFDGAETPVDISKVPDSEFDALLEQVEKWKKRKGPDGEVVEEKMRAFLENTPAARKKLRFSDLVTATGRTNLHKLYPQVESLVLQKLGTAAPKSVEAFTPYNGEIDLLEAKGGKDLVKYIASIAGVRSQSFSDFMIAHVFDVLQKTASLSARKLPAHTYTKEIARALLFGMTGEKHNMSVLHNIDPNVDSWQAGLSEDGQYLFSDYKAYRDGYSQFIQSIGWEDAVALQNTEGYSKDCGVIAVGFSYLHMKKIHADPDVRQVIGYHTSDMPVEVKPMTHLDKSTDYTPVQNTLNFGGFAVPQYDIPDGVPSYATPPQDVMVGRKGPKTKKSSVQFDIKARFAELSAGKTGAARTAAAKQTLRELLQLAEENGLVLKTTKAKDGHGDFNLYEDLEKTGDPYMTTDHYIEHCIENGWLPMFYEFALDQNYYKDNFDFNVFDRLSYNPETGLHEDTADRKAYAPQTAVHMLNEDGTLSFPEDFFEIVDKQMAGYDQYQQYVAQKMPEIMRDIRSIKDDSGKPMISKESARDEEAAKYGVGKESGKVKMSDRDFPDNAESVAKEHFGTTNKWAETGWLLQDGTQLDFSGRHWERDPDNEIDLGEGFYSGHRNVEHYEIAEAFPELRELSKMEYRGEHLDKFLKRGNIRVVGDGMLDIETMPTEAQIEKLRGYFRENIDKYIVIGIGAGGLEFREGTKPATIIEAIRDYFSNNRGSQSELMQFHTRFSDRDFTDVTDRAVKRFGTTTDFAEAGFILPSGEMLKFTDDKHRGERQYDHRAIGMAYGVDVDLSVNRGFNKASNKYLDEFVESGGIRFDPGSLEFDFDAMMQMSASVPPTTEQEHAIREFIKWKKQREEQYNPDDDPLSLYRGPLALRIDFGGTSDIAVSADRGAAGIKHLTYEGGQINADRIISDIRHYYQTGETRVQSVAARFHYSDRDSDGHQLSKEQLEFFNDSKVRDADGNLMVMYHGTANGGAFTVFDGDKLGNETRTTQMGQGFYFTNVKKEAEAYTKNVDIYGRASAGSSPHLHRVYLNITKPFNVTTDTIDIGAAKSVYMDGTYEYFFNEWIPFYMNRKSLNGRMFTKADVQAMSKAERVSVYVDYLSQLGTKEVLSNMVRAFPYGKQGGLLASMQSRLGYDGLVEEFKPGQFQYVAFAPEQVKATDNINPTTNPDIRYSDRDSAYQSEEDINRLRNEIEEIDDEMLFAEGSEEVALRNKRVKLQYQLDKLLDAERRAAKPTSLQTVLDNLKKYRRGDLESIANQLTDGAWDEIDDLPTDALIDGIREVINGRELSPLEMQVAKFGVYARDVSNWKYSDRDIDSVSNRDILANAFMDIAQNDVERGKIAEYQQKIKALDEDERKLRDIRAQLHDLSFSAGPRDNAKIRELREKATKLANRIGIQDKQLLRLEASKPLMAVLEREKKLAYSRASQKWEDRIETARTGRSKTEMRHKIKKIVGELNNLLLHGTKDKHIMIGLQKATAEALSAINMDTVAAEERLAKIQAKIDKATDPAEKARLQQSYARVEAMGDNMATRLTALKNAYEEIKDSGDPLVANAYQPEIEERIKNLRKMVGDTPLRNMSMEQLEFTYDTYKMVLTTIRNANKAFKNERGESIAVLGNRAMEEIGRVGGKKELVASAMRGPLGFAWSGMKPTYAFKAIGSDTLSEVFSQVRAGEDVWATDVNEAKEFYSQKTKQYHYDSWDLEKEYTFTSKSGKEFKLTLEQIMSLYAYSKRKQADAHLDKGGFVYDSSIEVVKRSKLGIPVKYRVNTAHAHALYRDTLMEICKTLTDEQVKFVDEMQDYLSVMGEKGNEVSLKMYGVKLFKEKFYFPLKSAKQFMYEQYEVAGDRKIKNSGFSKDTTPHASNPVILSNFTDVWATHVNDMAMYHAFVLPMEDFERVFNYKTPTSDTMPTESVKGYLQDAYGVHPEQYIKQLMTDLNGGARIDPTAGIINKGIALFKKSAVFASLSVVIQQPSAIARAMAYIDAKYFVGKPGLKDWDEVKKYAPVAIIKEMGYFDTNMGKSTVEFIKSKEYTGVKSKMKALVTDRQYRDEILSKAPSVADELAWCQIWNAVKKEIAETKKLQGEELLQAAGKRFTEVIVNTQVYDSVLTRSGMMRSKDTGMKMATSFMAEPTTSLNMIADALIQGKRGNKSYARKAIGAVAASMILNSILVSFVYAGRDDDEEKTYIEKYAGSLTSELIDSFNPLTLIPFVKDIVSIAQGYDVERSDMAVITDLFNAWKKLSSDNLSVYRKVEDFGGTIASIFGLPLKNIMRDVRGIYNTVKSAVAGPDTTGRGVLDAARESLPKWMGGGERSNADQLYAAMLSGDTAHVERLKARFKDDRAFTYAVRDGLVNNDKRITAAAEARAAGNQTEYMRLAREIVNEGHFSQDDVVRAVNYVLNSLTKKESEPAEATKPDTFKIDEYLSEALSGDQAEAELVKREIIAGHVADGKTEDEALKSFNNSFKNTAVKGAFTDGDITMDVAISMLQQYGGVEPDDAYADVQYWQFKKEHPDIYVVDSWFDSYYEYASDAGIGIDVYMQYRNDVKNITGEDKKERRMAAINALPLSPAQKDALYFDEGWVASKLYEAPWR